MLAGLSSCQVFYYKNYFWKMMNRCNNYATARGLSMCFSLHVSWAVCFQSYQLARSVIGDSSLLISAFPCTLPQGYSFADNYKIRAQDPLVGRSCDPSSRLHRPYIGAGYQPICHDSITFTKMSGRLCLPVSSPRCLVAYICLSVSKRGRWFLQHLCWRGMGPLAVHLI